MREAGRRRRGVIGDLLGSGSEIGRLVPPAYIYIYIYVSGR